MQIPLDELWAFIRAVEDGTITVIPAADPIEFYSGNLGYTASNGWRVVVFVDCGEWDYFDRIESGDGRVVTFDDLDGIPPLRDYMPTLDVVQRRYGIAGV